ncbi:hypothetical protein ACWAT4_27435 [Bradyrhizobium manausense]
MHISLAEGILIVIAVGQLLYAALTYHQDQGASKIESGSRKRPLRLIASMMLLTWAGVALVFYTRPSLPAAVLVYYGVAPPKQFHAVAQLTNWEDYKGKKAVLITRTNFADRDRLADDWIAKSIPYSIEGPIVTTVAITENQMHFTPGVLNFIEYNFAVLPPGIDPSQIRTLGDVEKLGGKILATASQGIPMDHPVPTTQPK